MGRHSESLRAGKSWDRIPVVATFSTPIQTGPGVKRPVCGVDHLTPHVAPMLKKEYSYLYSLSVPSCNRIG